MVIHTYIEKVLGQLEKYLLRKLNFHAIGSNYDLILLIPSDSFFPETKYSLLISSVCFDHHSHKNLIGEVLIDFKEHLTPLEYNSISRINILHSQDSFVRNFNAIFDYGHLKSRESSHLEIVNMRVGDILLERAYLVRSLILDKLIENHAFLAVLKDGTKVAMGLKNIDSEFNITYYTTKGLKEIFKPETEEQKAEAEKLKEKDENYLFENHYLATRRLDEIKRII